jgi:uncharacterized lipoprotein YmbA
MTIRRTMPFLLCLLLTGCSFFSRSQSRFYSLDRIPPTAPVVAVRGLPIGIDGIELPPGLDRREIVVRKPDHQLEVRSTDQWSALLQPLVLHTLAFDLADRLPEGTMVLPGEARPAGAIRSIDVVLEELAAGPDAKVVLDGRWVLKEPGRPDVTHHELITINITSLDSANVATGVSQAVAALADRIAANLR